MADYFEIDFLGVETAKSGDAITLRYSVNGTGRACTLFTVGIWIQGIRSSSI